MIGVGTSATPVLHADSESQSHKTDKIKYISGEHVAAFWYDNQNIKWHLGIVEELKHDKITIKYMTQADSAGSSWTFPEKAEILDTS